VDVGVEVEVEVQGLEEDFDFDYDLLWFVVLFVVFLGGRLGWVGVR